ncbi:MAG: hypothetical protein CVV24_13360 [Ignavibacteriae bacterium HGW-Ignavibacteriae-3]|nr:MAG: hypothetical protein CVV24_13360 [Ignavibacteriae bacterium HGW-Ignavibacteriae-3]
MSHQSEYPKNKPESVSNREGKSSTIRRELEEILAELGSDEKSMAIKIKIENALTALLNKGKEEPDPIKSLDSFSKNLEKILSDWDSLFDADNTGSKK